MAVRTSASGESLSRTTNLPGTTSHTIMAWVRWAAFNAEGCAFSLGPTNPASDRYITFTNGSGVLTFWRGGGVQAGSTLSTNTWYHIAQTVNGTGATACLVHLNGAINITRSLTVPNTVEIMHIGNHAGDGWADARFAAIKVWSAVLTTAEIQQEMQTIRPQRFADLNTWTPGFDGSGERARDYSGGGNNWTENGTLSDEDGPPVSWGASPIWIVGQAAGGAGTQYNQSADGTLTTAGTIVKATTKTFAGTLSTAGAIIKATAKTFAGTLTTAGTIIKSTAKTLAGTLTSSGALSTAKTMLRDLAGTLATAGALAKQTAKTFAGTLTSSGAIVKQTAKSLAGTLTSSGALETALAFLLSIGGTLTTAGTVTKQTAKSLSGTLTSAGALVRSTLKGLGGTLTPSGVLTTAKTLYRALTGAVSFAGDLAGVLNGGSQQFFQDVGGTLATAGALAKYTTKTFVGTLTSAGSLAKQTAKTLAGTLTSSGALTTLRAFLISLGGTLTTSGALVKMTGKNVAGTLTPAGAISKAISRAVGGTLSFLGTLLGVLQGFVIPHLDVEISDAAVYSVALTDSLAYSVESTDSSVYQVMITDTSRS